MGENMGENMLINECRLSKLSRQRAAALALEKSTHFEHG
jgi:hypothetical protein